MNRNQPKILRFSLVGQLLNYRLSAHSRIIMRYIVWGNFPPGGITQYLNKLSLYLRGCLSVESNKFTYSHETWAHALLNNLYIWAEFLRRLEQSASHTTLALRDRTCALLEKVKMQAQVALKKRVKGRLRGPGGTPSRPYGGEKSACWTQFSEMVFCVAHHNRPCYCFLVNFGSAVPDIIIFTPTPARGD
jgi:hypothetical protein